MTRAAPALSVLAAALATTFAAAGCTCDGAPRSSRGGASSAAASSGVATGESVPLSSAPSAAPQKLPRLGEAARVDPNARLAHHLASRCDEGAGRACWLLGQAFERGVGVEANPRRAASLYARSCEGPATWGCVDALRLRLATDGHPDTPFAELPVDDQANLIRACSDGDGRACTRLGRTPRPRPAHPTVEEPDPLDVLTDTFERCVIADDADACATVRRDG